MQIGHNVLYIDICKGKPHKTLSNAHSVFSLIPRKRSYVNNNPWKIKQVKPY